MEPELVEESCSGVIGVVDLLAVDELNSVGDFGCLLDLVVGGLRVTVEDVLEDGVVEQDRLLHHQTHCVSQLLQVVVSDVDAIDGDRAVVNVIETKDQRHDRRLAAT